MAFLCATTNSCAGIFSMLFVAPEVSYYVIQCIGLMDAVLPFRSKEVLSLGRIVVDRYVKGALVGNPNL